MTSNPESSHNPLPDPGQASLVNGKSSGPPLPRLLAKAEKEAALSLHSISSDCVFAGNPSQEVDASLAQDKRLSGPFSSGPFSDGSELCTFHRTQTDSLEGHIMSAYNDDDANMSYPGFPLLDFFATTWLPAVAGFENSAILSSLGQTSDAMIWSPFFYRDLWLQLTLEQALCAARWLISSEPGLSGVMWLSFPEQRLWGVMCLPISRQDLWKIKWLCFPGQGWWEVIWTQDHVQAQGEDLWIPSLIPVH